jgi:serine/threonine protein kinase
MVRHPGVTETGDAMTVQVATEAGMVTDTVGLFVARVGAQQPAVPESDIFAFGAILYEMVSGKRVFHRDSAADTMSAILHEEPPDLTETARSVPSGLERVVRHCLEKNPAQPFHSAGDLAFDLEAVTDITSIKSGL